MEALGDEGLDRAGHGRRQPKVLSCRPHVEAPTNTPGRLRGADRFALVARHSKQEGPNAAGLSRDAAATTPPARQTRVAPVGRRPRGAGSAEPETGALHHPASASIRPDTGR